MFADVKSPNTGRLLFRLDASRLLIEVRERRDVFVRGKRNKSEHIITLIDLSPYLGDILKSN
jgi:hypothetical protein